MGDTDRLPQVAEMLPTPLAAVFADGLLGLAAQRDLVPVALRLQGLFLRWTLSVLVGSLDEADPMHIRGRGGGELWHGRKLVDGAMMDSIHAVVKRGRLQPDSPGHDVVSWYNDATLRIPGRLRALVSLRNQNAHPDGSARGAQQQAVEWLEECLDIVASAAWLREWTLVRLAATEPSPSRTQSVWRYQPLVGTGTRSVLPTLTLEGTGTIDEVFLRSPNGETLTPLAPLVAWVDGRLLIPCVFGEDRRVSHADPQRDADSVANTPPVRQTHVSLTSIRVVGDSGGVSRGAVGPTSHSPPGAFVRQQSTVRARSNSTSARRSRVPRVVVGAAVGSVALAAALLASTVRVEPSPASASQAHLLSPPTSMQPVPRENPSWSPPLGRDIAVGTFRLGSPPDEHGRSDDEGPLQVRLTRPFRMDVHETTQAQWFELMGTRPSFQTHCGDDCPVESVNWYEVLEFANARSRAEGFPVCYTLSACSGVLGEGPTDTHTGAWSDGRSHTGSYRCDVVRVETASGDPRDCAGYRLPTEAEWEFAARAGKATQTFAGNVERHDGPHAGLLRDGPVMYRGQALSTIAVYSGHNAVDYPGARPCREASSQGEVVPDRCGIRPVEGDRRPNPWGLYDMLGNAREWVWDEYGPYESLDLVDPIRPPSLGTRRVLRGGGWSTRVSYIRSAKRTHALPETRSREFGFRLVRTLSTVPT